MHVRTSKLIVAWECRILRPFWVSVMFKTHWMFRFNIHLCGSLQHPWKSVVKSMGRIPLPSAVSINNSSFMSETLLITPKYLLEVPPSASQMKYHLPPLPSSIPHTWLLFFFPWLAPYMVIGLVFPLLFLLEWISIETGTFCLPLFYLFLYPQYLLIE